MRGLSLVLTLFSIILVITLAFTIAVPTLADSARSIVPLVKEKWPEWAAFLNSYNIDLSQVSEWIQPSDWEKLSSGANVLWDSAVSVASIRWFNCFSDRAFPTLDIDCGPFRRKIIRSSGNYFFHSPGGCHIFTGAGRYKPQITETGGERF